MTKKKEKVYTETQKKFLEIFMDPKYEGNIRKAMDDAGYSKNTRPGDIIETLGEEIVERAKKVIAAHSMKAAFSLVGILDSPDGLGAQTKLKTAQQILDRAGVTKKEDDTNINVSNPNGIIILPAKGSEVIINEQNKTEEEVAEEE